MGLPIVQNLYFLQFFTKKVDHFWRNANFALPVFREKEAGKLWTFFAGTMAILSICYHSRKSRCEIDFPPKKANISCYPLVLLSASMEFASILSLISHPSLAELFFFLFLQICFLCNFFLLYLFANIFLSNVLLNTVQFFPLFCEFLISQSADMQHSSIQSYYFLHGWSMFYRKSTLIQSYCFDWNDSEFGNLLSLYLK